MRGVVQGRRLPTSRLRTRDHVTVPPNRGASASGQLRGNERALHHVAEPIPRGLSADLHPRPRRMFTMSRRSGKGEISMNKGKFVMWGSAAALAMYFLDPDRGNNRRAHVLDRIDKLFKRGTETADGGQSLTTQSRGAAQQEAHAGSAQSQSAAGQVPAATSGREEMPSQTATENVPSGNENET